MPGEQVGTTAVLLPAEPDVERGPDTTAVAPQTPTQDRLLQALRELHDLELLAGVER